MLVETDPEIRRLRTVLRDLVALSAIPAAWVDREPSAVAAGLADTLMGLLQLDLAFVQFRDPGGGGGVEVTRGAWDGFAEWLERRLATTILSRKEIVHDVGAGLEGYVGVVIPVGVDAEGGVVAAASERPDFPTETEQLMLSLAANHAATAFQSARLIHERKRAEEELRGARDELEVKVAERTVELQRSQAYLTDAQRLTRTGTVAINIATGELTHSSDEHSRLYGFDPEQSVPRLKEFIERVHPEDRAEMTERLQQGLRGASSFELEFRVVPPHGGLRYVRALAHPVFAPSGEVEEFVGTVVDVTEHRRAEEERRASRARIVSAADEARRRIERDLHDGVQQRLVSLGMELRAMEDAASHDDELKAQLAHTANGLAGALEDLVEISRGIHPAILAEGGLAAALTTLSRRSAVPVELDVRVEARLPEAVEVAAYYVVSEALTNAAKHAHASTVHVAVDARDDVLELSIRDDGSGGADARRGSGLIGLSDRVDALGGTIELTSPVGEGTTLLATLPLEDA